MNVHEYQAKQVLKEYGVRVPEGVLIEEGPDLATRASEAARNLAFGRGNSVWVVKAQIHAGGRGKAGGVKVCRDAADVGKAATEIMGRTLVTPQTGPQGKRVNKLWLEEGAELVREFYLSILIDRALGQPLLLVSTEGGMDIEEVAARHPEKIARVAIDPAIGFRPYHARRLAKALGLDAKLARESASFFEGLYRCFMDEDCSLLEVNPLALTKQGLLALDTKMVFDDNALFRHPKTCALRDEAEENPQDVEASKHDLSYVALDGNIGCLVNGAGLAMATMDIIKLHGGSPANFLDVGGSASKEKVCEAFKLIMKDPKVRAILVNIFGGIMKCDVIAEGVVAAMRELKLEIPLVVRLQGTHVDRGREILKQSGLRIVPADGLEEAARAVVGLAGGK